MKYILKTPLLVLCFIIVIILGYFVGNAISTDFAFLYLSKLTQIPARYLLIIVILSSNLLIFKQQNCLAISIRKRSFFNAVLSINKYEIYILLLLFVAFNLPIMIQNGGLFFENIHIVIKLYINYIVVSLFMVSIIKGIDVIVNNRTISCVSFFIALSIIDILLQHGNYFIFNDIYFDLSYIFCLPYIYNHYYIIAIILTIITVFFNLLSIFFRIKKDFMLESIYEEN